MPLTPHGERMMSRLEREYDPETAKRVFYASRNMGKKAFKNVDRSKKHRKKHHRKARRR